MEFERKKQAGAEIELSKETLSESLFSPIQKQLMSIELEQFAKTETRITSCTWRFNGIKNHLNFSYATTEEILDGKHKERGLYLIGADNKDSIEQHFELCLEPQELDVFSQVPMAINTISAWLFQNPNIFEGLLPGEERHVSYSDVISGEKINIMSIGLLGAHIYQALLEMSEKLELSDSQLTEVSDLMMGVLAGFEGSEIYNDPSLPVKPYKK